MARTDVIVLGAGIVGTSAALQLAKRGVAVALVDKRGPGEETSYGNTGILGGSGAFPVAFPDRISDLIRIAFKRAPEANYYLSFLPKVAPWLLAFRAASRPQRLIETARRRHPLMSRAGAEHELLAAVLDQAAGDQIRLGGILRRPLPGALLEDLPLHLVGEALPHQLLGEVDGGRDQHQAGDLRRRRATP